jgi:hypothetical protein
MAELSAAALELIAGRTMLLGPGTPNAVARVKLAALTPQTLFMIPAKNVDFANGCLAGLWLLHDFLDESHSLSQDISTAEGSWWHAIMHRREPDYGNSKYWFRRVGRHPAFQTINEKLISLGLPEYDPFAFVDRCERAARSSGDEERICREIQAMEWQVLFDHCRERAG